MNVIRFFGPEARTPVPNPEVQNLYGVPIQLPAEFASRFTSEQMEERFRGLPFVLNQKTFILAHYFEENGLLHEHDALHPILFIVIGGSGFVRLGGEQGETFEVKAGMTVLWPPKVLHKAWTENTTMQTITIEYPPEEN